MGVIASPTFQYDPHSVWNRNQLGDLSSSPITMLILAGLAYWAYTKFVR